MLPAPSSDLFRGLFPVPGRAAPWHTGWPAPCSWPAPLDVPSQTPRQALPELSPCPPRKNLLLAVQLPLPQAIWLPTVPARSLCTPHPDPTSTRRCHTCPPTPWQLPYCLHTGS